jgi:hypothetical protein
MTAASVIFRSTSKDDKSNGTPLNGLTCFTRNAKETASKL